jgi:16S rRNA (cytosine1402-N4)-methyltransferase
MRSPSTGEVEDPYSALFHPGRSGRKPIGAPPVGGLRMSRPFDHEPVMAAEIVELFRPVPPGVIADATVGGGGHAAVLLRAHPQLTVVGLDRDPAAVNAARERLAPFGSRARVVHARFDQLRAVVGAALSGALFDLGVSSPQLDRGERGFSYQVDAPLDMRMDPTEPTTAADVVNTMPEGELTRIIAESGEGRFARRIARAIVSARPIQTTARLADVVRNAIPAAARRTGGHPARRVFQAVRIEVNQELKVLPGAIDDAVDLLVPGGRIAVLSYHSGEDRIVKSRLTYAATGGCVCPPGLPCACGAVPVIRLLNRGARKPAASEVATNRRAESARLRAAEKLSVTPAPGSQP